MNGLDDFGPRWDRHKKPTKRLLGFAPGGYENKCDVCEEYFVGAKRAYNCYDCAVSRMDDLFNETEKEKSALANQLAQEMTVHDINDPIALAEQLVNLLKCPCGMEEPSNFCSARTCWKCMAEDQISYRELSASVDEALKNEQKLYEGILRAENCDEK